MTLQKIFSLLCILIFVPYLMKSFFSWLALELFNKISSLFNFRSCDYKTLDILKRETGFICKMSLFCVYIYKTQKESKPGLGHQ